VVVWGDQIKQSIGIKHKQKIEDLLQWPELNINIAEAG
jgi:hypothetical protein